MTATLPTGPRVWLLLDDRAGNRSQCLGVAEALGLDYEVRELEYAPTAMLPNAVLGASLAGLTTASRQRLAPPWPDILIAAGRRAATVARVVKRRSGNCTALVQIMFPGRTGIDDFDLVAVPGHDGIAPRPNLITITGAPHRITADRLREAADEWRPRFAGLPRPWIALIVGGSTRRRRFTTAMAGDLGRGASAAAAAAGGSLLVTTSRRTGTAAPALLAAIDVPRSVYGWGDAGDNPYLGYLALADAVIVTGESVSMCSEACAAPAPVYVFAPPALITAKHGRLLAELYTKGYARPWVGSLETWHHPPLNAAATIATAITERLLGKTGTP